MMPDLLVLGQQRKRGKEKRLGRAQTHKERFLAPTLPQGRIVLWKSLKLPESSALQCS